MMQKTVMIDGRGVRHYIENGRALCGKLADHLAECKADRHGRLCEACAAVIDDGGATGYDYRRVPARSANGRVWVGDKPKLRVADNDPTENFLVVGEFLGNLGHLQNPETPNYAFCGVLVYDAASPVYDGYCPDCLQKAAAYWHTLTPFDEIETGSIVRWNGRVKGFVSRRDGEVYLTGDAGIEKRLSPLSERAAVLLDPYTVDAIALRALADAPQMVNRLLVEMGHPATEHLEAA